MFKKCWKFHWCTLRGLHFIKTVYEFFDNLSSKLRSVIPPRCIAWCSVVRNLQSLRCIDVCLIHDKTCRTDVIFHRHILFSHIVFSSSVPSSVQAAQRASAICAAIVSHSDTTLASCARAQSRPKRLAPFPPPVWNGLSPISLHAVSIHPKHLLTAVVGISCGLQTPKPLIKLKNMAVFNECVWLTFRDNGSSWTAEEIENK